MNWVDYIILAVAVLVIIMSALQQSNDDAVDAFRGTSSDLFKNRKIQGAELFLNYGMTILGVVFVALVLVSRSMDDRLAVQIVQLFR